MKSKPVSPLLGQMTLFLLVFIVVSIVTLLLVGKPLEVNVKDFWGNRVKLPLETLVLGSASIALFAHFGAKFLTRPILILEEWTRSDALEIPKDVTERPDEIGHLARSMILMRNSLESERELLRTDRDIHRTLNQMRLLTLTGDSDRSTIGKLLSLVIVQANADAAMLVRRDPDGGGFTVVDARSADGDNEPNDSGGLIIDAFLPKKLLIRYLDTFEIPFEDLDGQAVSWVNKYLSDSSVPNRTFLNLPIENEGRYIGSLLIFRSRGGPSLEDLRPLAGGVIGSAKFIEASIERDENWISIMASLSRAVDAKSEWTNGHSDRVAGLAVAVGKKLLMEEKELMNLRIAALLHDVGKIAISESIIDKPGRLTTEEMEIMKQHPERGATIVENLPGYKSIRTTILHHHERWDGKGYPQGISGEEIPLHSRIIAISDVFDAITTDRPYRKGMPIEEALKLIESESWASFDGNVVRVFLTVAES